MNISITLELHDKMTLDQCVALHSKARAAGFADTDDYVTQVVINDLERKRAPKPRRRKTAKA